MALPLAPFVRPLGVGTGALTHSHCAVYPQGCPVLCGEIGAWSLPRSMFPNRSSWLGGPRV